MRHIVLGLALGTSLAARPGWAQQSDADSVPLTRRVLLAGATSYTQTTVTNGPSRTFDGSWLVRSFVSDALQVGIAPNYSLYREPFNRNGGNGWGSAVVDYGVAMPYGLRAYGGGYSFGFTSLHGGGWYRAGVHAGIMRFLGPSMALRLEQQWYGYSSDPFEPPIRETVLSLDPYFIRDDPLGPSLPGRGVVEVAGNAFVMDRPFSQSSASVTVAPYITPWLQVGTDLNVTSLPSLYTVHSADATIRLYVPYSPALLPFIGGTVLTSTSGNFDGGLSSYSGSVGVRHMMDRAIAVDVGVTWTATPHLFANRLSVFAKVALLARTK